MGANAFTAYPYTDPDITRAVGDGTGQSKLLLDFLTAASASITTARVGKDGSHYLTFSPVSGNLGAAANQADLDEFLANLFPSATLIASSYGADTTVVVWGDATPDWAAAEAGSPLTNGGTIAKQGTPTGAVAYLYDNGGVGTVTTSYSGGYPIDTGVTISADPHQLTVYEDESTDYTLVGAQPPKARRKSYWEAGYDLYAIGGGGAMAEFLEHPQA